MRKICRFALLLASLLLIATLLASCADKGGDIDEAEKLDISSMSDEQLYKYAQLGEYKGIEIKLDGRAKDEAVWSVLRDNATIKEYPAMQVEYYFAQAKAQYEYYAEEADMSYADMLAQLGTSEESMLSDAKNMAIGDVLFELVRRAEGIELSESEKLEHFDRYVKKYVDSYGYDEDYVKKNLADAVYESMLYDKVSEFLITNNSITE